MVVDPRRVDARPRKLHNRQVAMTRISSLAEERHVDCKRGHVLLQRVYINPERRANHTPFLRATPLYSVALPPSNFRRSAPGLRRIHPVLRHARQRGLIFQFNCHQAGEAETHAKLRPNKRLSALLINHYEIATLCRLTRAACQLSN